MSRHTASNFIPIKPSKKILMQLRDDGRGKKIPYPNMWNFLGGAKEGNEDYLETVIREAKEECDLEIKKNDCELIFIYDHDNTFFDHIYIFKVDESWEPEVREGKKMIWMDLDEIKGLELAYNQEKILPALEKYIDHKRN